MPDTQSPAGLLLSRLPWSCALEAQGPELQGKREARRPAMETKPGQERSQSMIYKRGKWYHRDDTVNGVRYRLPLRTKNWQEALRLEKEKITAIAQGKAAVNGAARQSFEAAVDAYLQNRKLHSAPRTHQTDTEKSKPLLDFFGKKGGDFRLRQISADTIAQYQARRIERGLAGRTVNMEVGLLRRILKKNKQWARLSEDVEMLPQPSKEPRILSPEEKSILLATASSKPQWLVAHCAA